MKTIWAFVNKGGKTTATKQWVLIIKDRPRVTTIITVTP